MSPAFRRTRITRSAILVACTGEPDASAKTSSAVPYTAEAPTTLREDDTLDGGDALPGFKIRVGDIFPDSSSPS